MNPDSAHTSGWAIGETVFGIPLLAGIALQILFPLHLVSGWIKSAFVFVGILLILIGWPMIALARKELARQGQPTDPGKPTGRIVTSGVFSISRNPMYLGCVFFLLGLAFVVNNIYITGALLVSIVLCEIVLIRPEERYLEDKFGQEYLAYEQAVHRWIGHL